MFLTPAKIICYPLLDSTMDEARRLLDTDSLNPLALTVILADAQNQARGRRQRPWFSPLGNFYASFIMPWRHPFNTLGQMSFVYGLAVIEALQHYLPSSSDLQCKWPNDILYKGEKVAGILLETHTPPQSNAIFLIAGVGINIITAPNSDTEKPSATFLQAHSQTPIVIADLLEHCLKSLEKWANTWNDQGFSPIRKMWLEWARAQGKGVTVRLEKNGMPIQGRFIDLDEQGALVFETPEGKRHSIYTGDVFFDGC
jgi:BirA family biotin operon repressor/biotin-[acetyl-CoA-carboxylase] ligase